MPRWGATNKLPRDENGWRIPTEGTKSRRIYDAIKSGRSPDDIQVEMAATTKPSSVLSMIASLKPYVSPVVVRSTEDRNIPKIDRKIPIAEPEPPLVQGHGNSWWAYVSEGWGAYGQSPTDAIYNLLTWRRPPWGTLLQKPNPADFKIIDTSQSASRGDA